MRFRGKITAMDLKSFRLDLEMEAPLEFRGECITLGFKDFETQERFISRLVEAFSNQDVVTLDTHKDCEIYCCHFLVPAGSSKYERGDERTTY